MNQLEFETSDISFIVGHLLKNSDKYSSLNIPGNGRKLLDCIIQDLNDNLIDHETPNAELLISLLMSIQPSFFSQVMILKENHIFKGKEQNLNFQSAISNSSQFISSLNSNILHKTENGIKSSLSRSNFQKEFEYFRNINSSINQMN